MVNMFMHIALRCISTVLRAVPTVTSRCQPHVAAFPSCRCAASASKLPPDLPLTSYSPQEGTNSKGSPDTSTKYKFAPLNSRNNK